MIHTVPLAGFHPVNYSSWTNIALGNAIMRCEKRSPVPETEHRELALSSACLRRYGVRGCFRHLCYLNDLLDRIDRGLMIDPTLIHFSFAFCASHVYGSRTDRVGSITHEEKEKFQEVKERLRQILEEQITNFR